MSGPYQGRDLSNCGVGRLRVAINCGVLSVKKRAEVIPYSFSSSIALLSSLLSCSFYILDPRTISRVDILEMT